MTALLIEGQGSRISCLDVFPLSNRFCGYYCGIDFLPSQDREAVLWYLDMQRNKMGNMHEGMKAISLLVAAVLLLLLFVFRFCLFVLGVLLHSSVYPQSSPVPEHPHQAPLCIFCGVRCFCCGRVCPFLGPFTSGRCVPGHTSAASSVVPALVTWIQTALSFQMA